MGLGPSTPVSPAGGREVGEHVPRATRQAGPCAHNGSPLNLDSLARKHLGSLSAPILVQPRKGPTSFQRLTEPRAHSLIINKSPPQGRFPFVYQDLIQKDRYRMRPPVDPSHWDQPKTFLDRVQCLKERAGTQGSTPWKSAECQGEGARARCRCWCRSGVECGEVKGRGFTRPFSRGHFTTKHLLLALHWIKGINCSMGWWGE